MPYHISVIYLLGWARAQKVRSLNLDKECLRAVKPLDM